MDFPIKHLVLALLLALSVTADDVIITNRCNTNIFVKNEGVNTGPLNLPPNESRTVTVNRNGQPKPRIWGHVGCDGAGNNCDTTEGYVSLAEFQIDPSGWLWFDVSQVDGYNLPITMEGINPAAGGNCRVASCNFNTDADCPQANKVVKDGRAVACKNLDRDNPSDYSNAVKRSCPGVYSYAFDSSDVMRDCLPGNNGLKVTFC
ncbi:Pathogenesis-related protein 5 [Orchesella cincta]|uniref:Pathogenesis-related protein 5 n=1 Tax=Orchesella cincta TaxID=48709 RepID=A0A1D2NA69_ORCCI|nr:Pathogenesis-related protein 5 [Orchesella cincta]